MSAFTEPNTFRVGIVGLVLTCAAVLTAQNYDKLPLLGVHREYRAYFGDAAGLKVGEPVEVAGVQVGKVEKIQLSGDKILVEFSVDGVTLGADTEAAIKTFTVLGSKMIELRPRGAIPLSPHTIIGLDHTSTPYILTDALGEVTTQISGLNLDNLTKALDVLGDTLDQAQPGIGAALTGVAAFSTSISSRDALLKNLLSHTVGVTDILAKRSTQLNELILDGNTLFAALDQRRQSIGALLTNLSAASRQLSALVVENRSQLRPVLESLNAVVDLLRRHEADITKALVPLSQYALSLGESVAAGPFFKAYVGNLLPGQFLQPFIDAAFAKAGVNPGILGSSTYPVPGGYNSPPGTIPPTDTRPGLDAPVPSVVAPPFPTTPRIPARDGGR